jgi:hypothetical protein
VTKKLTLKELKHERKEKLQLLNINKRGRTGKLALNMNSTRCDTMRYVTSPKTTIGGFQDFNMYKDDFYDK